MLTIRPSRQELYADDPKFLWKYVLRSLAITFAFISIGLIGWSLAHQVVSPSDIYGYAYYDWPYNSDIWRLSWEFIPLALSIIWNTTNILVLIRTEPIHPGATVACDLLLWLGFIVTAVIATGSATSYLGSYHSDHDTFNQDPPTRTSANGSTSFILPNGTLSNSSSIPCDVFTSCGAPNSYPSAVNRRGVIVAVCTALGFIVLLMHFALFVSACRYTHARQVNTKAAVVAERMYDEKVGGGGAEERNPNTNGGFVPVTVFG